MILRSSPASPFGRKVKIAADLAGLTSGITVVPTDTTSETDSIRRENPLGKIPALILADGTAIYDSRVIIDYLDQLAGTGVLIPADPQARLRCLITQALADGLIDASILRVYEVRFRAETERSATWVAYQADKVKRCLASLEGSPPTGTIDVGHIAVACALGYLDLRFEGAWRADYPALVTWLAAFSAAVPAFDKTVFKPS